MPQFVIQSLNYTDDMHFFYEKLNHLPGFVLLESSDKLRGQYDIVSALPYDYLRIDEDGNDLQQQLQAISARLHTEPSLADLPFQGGAIGFISYDLGARLCGIQSKVQASLNDMPLLNLGLYDWAIITDHRTKKVTLFAGNQHEGTQDIVARILTLWHEEKAYTNAYKVGNEFAPLITYDKYAQSFSAIKDALTSGRCYQVNLTQAFHSIYQGDTWPIYHQVSTNNPVPFSAFLRTDQADILSFSPERFLLHNQGVLLTSPIKGTIRRSDDLAKDLLLKKQLSSCEKNRAENVMIVDLSRNDLSKIAKTHSVRVSNLCEVQSFKAVHHLVSDVQATCLPTITPFEAFISCFPGGSITGAPKLESMQVIHEQEEYARGVYCGSIGYFSRHGRFDSSIAIRTITAKNGILHLAAGGGIVIDSECDEEYQECYTKIVAIINGLKQ